MSENIFYKSLLELPSFRVDGVEKTPTQLLISGHVPVATSVCPQCAQVTGLAHQYTTRLVLTLAFCKNYVCDSARRRVAVQSD